MNERDEPERDEPGQVGRQPLGDRPANPARPLPFRQRTAALELRLDVSKVAEALDALEGPAAR